MSIEMVGIVNENGGVLGTASRAEAYERGLLHPAVSVMVFNSQGEIYLQQRSAGKEVFTLYWDISTAEHLKPWRKLPGRRAMRGLREELSVVITRVTLLREPHIQDYEYSNGRKVIKERERVQLFGAAWDGQIRIDPAEVAGGMFVPFSELGALVASKVNDFTPWGQEEINFILQNPKSVKELGI